MLCGMTVEPHHAPWLPSACVLCECNCGVEVQLGGDDGRRLVRVRGDRQHPASRGYVCEKAQRLDYYQNGRDRVLYPQRRRPDGTYETIDWDTAISEVAARLAGIRDTHGGESIFYYGGGGQGNHLPGAYAAATRRALGSRYRSNALAQEKTGEFWVSHRMLGAHTRGDFEGCEVAVFLGKNPWLSHSIPRARVTLKAISKDPARTLIVIDPRRTRTAALADIHLQVRPGGDPWLVAAMAAIVVQEDLLDREFLQANADGLDAVVEALTEIPVADYCGYAGVPEASVRRAAGVIGRARSVASFEDLGVQMNRHSTLVSYMHRLVWLLTGNLGREGSQYVPTSMVALADGAHKRDSPVVGARIIGGLVPCNRIADEILTDHPARYRAMIIETANPAHSLADSPRVREALGALDTLVVIDVAMTETARLADYVLPASTQYEKAEATFFNVEFPHNTFHLRRPLLDAPPGPLPEAEIHARLCEALGALDADLMGALRVAAAKGRAAFAAAFMAQVSARPATAGLAPVILYRTLGPTLPHGLAPAAVLWGLAMRFAARHPESLARAGFPGPPPIAGEALFEAIVSSPRGVVISVDDWGDVLPRVGGVAAHGTARPRRIQLALDDLLTEMKLLGGGPPPRDRGFPFTLSAGERRSFTANTIVRHPGWRRRDGEGALRVSPSDARALGLAAGDSARLTTRTGSCVVTVHPGHISLPNGTGLSNLEAGSPEEPSGGTAPNELTAAEDRDRFVGTPWHKCVPARLEPV